VLHLQVRTTGSPLHLKESMQWKPCHDSSQYARYSGQRGRQIRSGLRI